MPSLEKTVARWQIHSCLLPSMKYFTQASCVWFAFHVFELAWLMCGLSGIQYPILGSDQYFMIHYIPLFHSNRKYSLPSTHLLSPCSN